MKSKSQIDPREHLVHPLRVHALLRDFKLEDVWCLPIRLNADQGLELIIQEYKKATGMLNKGAAANLFKLRKFLGKLFRWDEKVVQDKLLPGSIRKRYADQEGLKFEDLPNPGSESFVPVYQLENEFLAEIENKTVQGAIHFCRIPIDEDTWEIHMAIYVKPKGLFGRLYMMLITPFRLWIVYPAMLNAVRERWNAYLKRTQPN